MDQREGCGERAARQIQGSTGAGEVDVIAFTVEERNRGNGCWLQPEHDQGPPWLTEWVEVAVTGLDGLQQSGGSVD